MEQNLSMHAGVAIAVSSDGVFSATVGKRKVTGATMAEVRSGIDACHEDAAGEQRKDVNVPVRLRVKDRVVHAVYLGIRANGKHAFRLPGEPKPVHPEDYFSDFDVVPDSVPDFAIVEFDNATTALAQAQARQKEAVRALRGQRVPWHANPAGDMQKNTGRLREQERFTKELLGLKQRGLPS